MRDWLRVTLVTAGATLALIQIIRPSRNSPQPRADHSIHAVASMSPAAGSVLQRSCNDCHSNHTVWPWYCHVAPISWLVAHDVHRGRRALNLSNWGGYSPEQRAELLQDMCEEVSQGKMPGNLYAAMHRQARLSVADRQQFCEWTQRLAGGATGGESHIGDVAASEED